MKYSRECERYQRIHDFYVSLSVQRDFDARVKIAAAKEPHGPILVRARARMGYYHTIDTTDVYYDYY